MKQFNFKSRTATKFFLYSGLLVALGFNLSWNPEQPKLARLEHAGDAFELASLSALVSLTSTPSHAGDAGEDTAVPKPDSAAKPVPKKDGEPEKTEVKPKTETAAPIAAPAAVAKPRDEEVKNGQFKLGEVASALPNVKVGYSINGDATKLNYSFLEGRGACAECEAGQQITIDPKDASNIEFLKREIARHAAEKIRLSRTAKPAEPAVKKPEPEVTTVRREERARPKTQCRGYRKDKEDFLDCQVDEFTALNETCEKLEDKEAKTAAEERALEREQKNCDRKVQAYFNTLLSPTLRAGLSSDMNSQFFSAAQSARDQLITEIPQQHSAMLKSLTMMTGQGMLARTQAYDTQMQAQCRLLAQNNCDQIVGPRSQMFLKQQMALSSPLKMALSQSSDPTNALLMYNSSFETPLMKLISQNASRGMDWTAAMASFDTGATDLDYGNGTNLPGLNGRNGPVLPGSIEARTGPQARGSTIPNGSGVVNGFKTAPANRTNPNVGAPNRGRTGF